MNLLEIFLLKWKIWKNTPQKLTLPSLWWYTGSRNPDDPEQYKRGARVCGLRGGQLRPRPGT